MQVVELFSIPIYRFKFLNHLMFKESIMPFMNDNSTYAHNTRPNSKLEFTIPDLHKQENFKPFRDFVQESAEKVMIDLGFEPGIQITGIWGIRHQEGAGHHRHNHGNSFLGGVYYLNGNEKNSGTVFYNPITHMNQIIPARQRAPKIQIRHFELFNEGTLVIFPAWLEHDTRINNLKITNSVRHILAFNSMPLGKTNHDEFDRFDYQDISESDMISIKKFT